MKIKLLLITSSKREDAGVRSLNKWVSTVYGMMINTNGAILY